MNHLKNPTILLFLCINLCCALSIKAQCNNSNKRVGALIAIGTDNGQKTPLILIHGIHGTAAKEKLAERNSYWYEFFKKFYADKELTSKYALYVFQYYSNQESVQDIACELGLFIDEKIPDRQHVILAHSMGGLVAKAYMVYYQHKNGKKGGETVLGAITLATPHHGTHGTNDVNALKQYIGFGWKQVIDKLNFTYWSSRAGFFSPQSLASGMPNRGDLRWDNYDNAIPTNSLPNFDVNIWLPSTNVKFERYSSKVILYAGVLRLENIANSPQAALAEALGNLIYDNHKQLSFANDILVNGFSKKFGGTDGLVPYKSALLCDTPPYRTSSGTSNFVCISKFKVRRFEAGKADALPNEIPDANTLSIERTSRGYDHKDMYEHPDVLKYVAADLKEFIKNKNPSPKPPSKDKSREVRKNSIGMEFVFIPPGEFMMGSENRVADEKPVRRIKIKEGFWMARYEVTQAQWKTVMGTTLRQLRGKANSKWSIYGEGPNYPIYYVNWEDAQEFIRRLNEKNDGFQYSLPTEAQWEYSARAGTSGDYYGNLDEIAWYGNNSGREYLDSDDIVRSDFNNYFRRITGNGGQAHPVGMKEANNFGLYDMTGNVWEWCEDIYSKNGYSGLPRDGSANLNQGEPNSRILRGGSWNDIPHNSRSASRNWFYNSERHFNNGFRLVARVGTYNEASDSYFLRIYNVDDLARVYINGSEIAQVRYKSNKQINITNMLRPGNNEIRFVTQNFQEGFTYGFEVYRNNESIFQDECGDNNKKFGCRGNNSPIGVVYDQTIKIQVRK